MRFVVQHKSFITALIPLWLVLGCAEACNRDPDPQGTRAHAQRPSAPRTASPKASSKTAEPRSRPSHADAPPPHSPATNAGTRVVLLGTGTPVLSPRRAGSAVAVVVADQAYVVDFGANVVRRAAAAARKHGIPALRPAHLHVAFCTHLHSDHTLGYPNLLLAPWVVGRSEPVDVYGPPGLERMTDHLLEAYRADIRIRSRGPEGASEDGYRARVHLVDEPGRVYEDAYVNVRAFEVDHGTWKHAFGYRFETEERVIVISGDTRPTQSVVEACDGCDVLVHEVYARAGLKRLPAGARGYHEQFHTSGTELGRIAAEAAPELLVLYHQLTWGASRNAVLEAIRAHYGGRLVWGEDLDVF